MKKTKSLVAARSSCHQMLLKEITFSQSGKIHSGTRTCLYCHRIEESWDKEKKEWIEKEG